MAKAYSAAACLLLVLLAGCGGPKWGSVAPMDPAPDFALKDIHGRTVRLSELRGRVVLLDFWATFCDTCKDSFPFFEKLNKTYRGRGVEVVGIDIDAYTGHVADFVKQAGINYTIVLDADRRVSMAYGVRKVPETFLIDKDGIIRKKWISFLPEHTTEIPAGIEALLEPHPGAVKAP